MNAFTFNLELNKTYLVYWSEDKTIPPAKCVYTEYDSKKQEWTFVPVGQTNVSFGLNARHIQECVREIE